VIAYVREHGGEVPYGLDPILQHAGAQGATPLVVANGNEIVGVVILEDILKPGIRERIQHLRKMGLHTVMVTGDNSLTAATIARLSGVNEFIAEATPEAKLAYLRREQAEGKLVAMMGDGTNDAPALAQADVGLAMNSGTQAAKEAGNMVDLDSDPTKLIEVIEIGKQLLMTRGALTTFSIANDVAKYFAIVPALFAGTLPWLGAMDVMHLHSPTSAILSAVIFNALIIPLLIPIALKGVRYRALGADALLRRNLLVWGLGGVIVPFAGIKLIDLVMVGLHLVA
jgi:K+-transporting ATPase ATPase B chain